ncbi:hypothetical protein J6590_082344 [Homalodisca vitripennis]|nr:hypothetical protein J6590_082344 [Homalodisca vitripennis]
MKIDTLEPIFKALFYSDSGLSITASEDWVMEGVDYHVTLETRMSAPSGFTPVNCMIVTTTCGHGQLGYSGATDLPSSFFCGSTVPAVPECGGKNAQDAKKV